MSLGDLLKDKFVSIAALCGALVFCSITLGVMGINDYGIFFIVFIIAAAFSAGIIYEFINKKRYYDHIIKILSSLNEKYLICEFTKHPMFFDGEKTQEILEACNHAMNNKIAEYKKITDDFKDYVELWVHEIKTPIASCHLICENNKNEVTVSINEEISKIDRYVEQALYYAKSSTADKDYIVNETMLQDIVSEVLKKNAKIMIEKKIKVSVNAQGVIYSDKKWITFIIDQIINNAVKYCGNNPSINIYTKDEKEKLTLYIEDNGIGIPAKDIGKVFEKGFTGTNGRKYGASTGMGLYLVKKLCNKLGLSVSASSTTEKTCFAIVFPKGSMHIFS